MGFLGLALWANAIVARLASLLTRSPQLPRALYGSRVAPGSANLAQLLLL
jgi:hypothetical protein